MKGRKAVALLPNELVEVEAYRNRIRASETGENE